jgi:hypothetical protein
VLASTLFRMFLVARVAVEVMARGTGIGSAQIDRAPHLIGHTAHVVIQIALYCVSLLVLVGLWRFRNWARVAYLVLLCLLVFALLVRPHPVFASTMFVAVWTLQFTLDGAILAMAFLPSSVSMFATRKA